MPNRTPIHAATHAAGVHRRAGAPLIGITGADVARPPAAETVSSPLAYSRAVAEAGGVPVILPSLPDENLMRHYVRRLDALLLSGGPDLPPETYGRRPHPANTLMSDRRYRFEAALAKLWLDGDKPVLAICLGIQLVNVVLGGTLIQDIPSQVGLKVKHRKAGPGDTRHSISISGASRLREIFPAGKIQVASSHHQAVETVADGLIVSAVSADGVVEALELPGRRYGLFVQWHPERMSSKHYVPLLRSLVGASAGAAGRR